MTGGDPFARPHPTARLRCLRCGHTWSPRRPDRPKRCPNLSCQSSVWDRDPKAILEEKLRWGCLLCRARWPSRYGALGRRPGLCPRCHRKRCVVALVGGRFPPGAKWRPADRTRCPTCHRPYKAPGK